MITPISIYFSLLQVKWNLYNFEHRHKYKRINKYPSQFW